MLGFDTTELDDEAFSIEAAQDRCILRLIASCCNGLDLQIATYYNILLSLHCIVLQAFAFKGTKTNDLRFHLTIHVKFFSGDKLVRATELVKLLSLEKSVKGAIKLVTALKLPNLAERFNAILEVGQTSSNATA